MATPKPTSKGSRSEDSLPGAEQSSSLASPRQMSGSSGDSLSREAAVIRVTHRATHAEIGKEFFEPGEADFVLQMLEEEYGVGCLMYQDGSCITPADDLPPGHYTYALKGESVWRWLYRVSANWWRAYLQRRACKVDNRGWDVPCDIVHWHDAELHAVLQRVSRVTFDNGQLGGYVTRITQSGLCVGALHTFLDEQGELRSAEAFGSELTYKASVPYFGIIFFQGAAGDAVVLDTLKCVPGKFVMRVALTDPTVAPFDLLFGKVSLVDPSCSFAAAEYVEEVPDAPGAPVMFNTMDLAGIHLITCQCDDVQAQQSKIDQDSKGADKKLQDPARERIDKNPHCIWPRTRATRSRTRATMSQKSEKRSIPAVLAKQASQLHPTHGTVSMFVPALQIAMFAQSAGLVEPSWLHQFIPR